MHWLLIIERKRISQSEGIHAVVPPLKKRIRIHFHWIGSRSIRTKFSENVFFFWQSFLGIYVMENFFKRPHLLTILDDLRHLISVHNLVFIVLLNL